MPSKKIKILMYTDTPIAGGAEKHMHLLAKYLLEKACRPIIACSKYGSLDRWCEEMQKDGIDVRRLQVSHKHDPRHFFQLRSILNKEKPDLLHLHLWNPGACRYAFFAATPQKIPILTTEHDPFELHGFRKMIKKWTLRRTRHTIAVSRANAGQMLAWYPEIENKITVIQNGIDLDQWGEKLAEAQTFSPQGKPTILSVAALHPRKGLKYLLEAFQKIHLKLPSSRLVLVGEGPQRDELKSTADRLAIQEAVEFTGPSENVAEFMKNADLFVLPSVKEAFGLVLVEAMAAGLPIVASNVGGIPEIIQDGVNGLLATPANSDDLADKMLQLLTDEKLREKLSSRHANMVQKFSAKRMAQETEKLYNQILSQLLAALL